MGNGKGAVVSYAVFLQRKGRSMNRKKRAVIAFLIMIFFLAAQLPCSVQAADPTLKAAKKTMYVGGDNYKIAVKNQAAGAKVAYSSSDATVAKVTKNGVVKPVAAGTAKITVKITQSKKTYSELLTVTVKKPYIKITNPVETMEVGETLQLEAVTGGMKQAKVTWSSSNTKVAKVNAKTRVLTAVAAGTAKITVKDTLSGLTNSFTVKVEAAKPTATPKPTATATPKPTATPTPKPTATPIPEDVEYAENDDFAYEIRKTGITITEIYDTEQTSVKIPGTIDGKKVVAVGDGLFSSLSEMKSVTLPSSLTTIGEYAFSSCYELTSVSIPKSVTTIGMGAFEYCESLKSITIPGNVKRVPEEAFAECTALKSVTLSSGVTVIEPSAFVGCVALSTLSLSDTLEEIGDYAFECCESLKSVKIPKSMKRIGEEAFVDCVALSTLTFASGIEEIAGYAFNGCLGLTSVTLPDSLKILGDGAFEYCENLKAATVPGSITELGSGVFDNCSENLKLKIKKNSLAYEYAVEYEIPYNTY